MTQDDLAQKLFVTRQTISNYETGKSRPDIEMLEKIAEVLEADIQSVLYGPEQQSRDPAVRRLIWGCILTGIFAIAWVVLEPLAQSNQRKEFLLSPVFFVYFVIKPPCCFFAGWTLLHLLGMALKKKPLQGKWVRTVGLVLLAILLVWFALTFLYAGLMVLDEWLYMNHIRGVWEEAVIETEDGPYISRGWSPMPLPMLDWLGIIPGRVALFFFRTGIPYSILFLIFGAVLRLCGIPWKGKRE